jgi:hypothetical protein
MTNNELQAKISAYTNKKNLIESYESKIRFLTETNPFQIAPQENYFFRIWKERIGNTDSVNNFINAFTNPNAGHSLIEEIWKENSKAFQARDFQLLFISKEEKEKPKFDLLNWWQTEAYALYQISPNGAAFWDGERMQTLDARVIDYVIENDGVISELCYTVNPGLKIVLSIGKTIWLQMDGSNIREQKEYSTGLDVCTAFRISDIFTNSEKVIRCNILNESYNDIADFVYEKTLAKINTNYAHACIIERTVSADSCNYAEEDQVCSGGYMVSIEDEDKHILNDAGARRECPSCRKKLGVGTEIKIPLRLLVENSGQLVNSIRFHSPDVPILQFSEAKLFQDRKTIFGIATGKDKTADQTKSFNSEMSLILAAEGQKAVLKDLQKSVEKQFKISAVIVAKASGFVGVNVILGDNFILYSTEQILLLKEKTDVMGLTEALRIDEQLVESASNGIESERKRGMVIVTLNKIIGIENTRKAVALYELNKGAINATTQTDKEIALAILKYFNTFATDTQPETEKEAGGQTNEKQIKE